LPIIEKIIVTQLIKQYPALCKPKVHHCVHKSPTLDPVLSQMNPILFDLIIITIFSEEYRL